WTSRSSASRTSTTPGLVSPRATRRRSCSCRERSCPNPTGRSRRRQRAAERSPNVSEGGLLGGGVSIDELVLADQPERWSALGFLVRDGVCQLGSVRVRLAGDGPQKGILSWSLRGLRGDAVELDGLP